jgi:hypothetical protein
LNRIILTALFLLLLSACTADGPPRETAADESSGPTIYGKLSVSVDRVWTD